MSAPICCGLAMREGGTVGSTTTGSFDEWSCAADCGNTTLTERR